MLDKSSWQRNIDRARLHGVCFICVGCAVNQQLMDSEWNNAFPVLGRALSNLSHNTHAHYTTFHTSNTVAAYDTHCVPVPLPSRYYRCHRFVYHCLFSCVCACACVQIKLPEICARNAETVYLQYGKHMFSCNSQRYASSMATSTQSLCIAKQKE